MAEEENPTQVNLSEHMLLDSHLVISTVYGSFSFIWTNLKSEDLGSLINAVWIPLVYVM